MILTGLIFGLLSFAQNPNTAVFPSRFATDNDLFVAKDLASSILSTTVNSSQLTIPVITSAPFTSPSLVTIDNETISICSIGVNVLNVCANGRGFNGTLAASHTAGKSVYAGISSYYFNQLASEVKATENWLYHNNAVNATLYNFTPQTPGGSLSIGSNTINLAPCPYGVNGTNIGHYLYISGGTGTPEAGLITGGTCTSGASTGTVIVTLAFNHTGVWAVSSATSGISEAINSVSEPIQVFIPKGQYSIHGPITIPPPPVGTYNWGASWTLKGAGKNSSWLNVAADFPLTVAGVIIAAYTPGTGSGPQPGQQYGPVIEDFHVVLPQTYTGRNALIHWPPVINGSGVNYGTIQNLTIEGAWDGIKVVGDSSGVPFNSGWLFNNIWMAAYDIGLNLDGAADITRIHGLHFWPFGAPGTVNGQQMMFDEACVGLKVGRLDGLYVSDSFFLSGTAVDFEIGADGGVTNLAHFVNTDFDVFGRVQINTASDVSFDNVDFVVNQDPGSGPTQCDSSSGIQFVAGAININNATFQRYCTGFPVVKVAPSGLQSTNPFFAQFTVTNSKFYDSTNLATAASYIQIVGNGSSVKTQVSLNGNQFIYGTSLAYTNPFVSATGSNLQLTFTGNTTESLAGTATLLNINFDDYHVIRNNNISAGWSVVLPTTKLLGIYEDQNFEYARGTPIVSYTNGIHSVTGKVGTYLGDATAGQVQFNLPFVSTAVGADFVFKKIDSSGNSVLIAPAGSDTIEGAANFSLTSQWQSVRLHCLNGVWYKE